MHHRKKTRSPEEIYSGSRATEFTCGCIFHPVAGRIRQCGALGARTLGGRFVKLDADIGKHTAGEIKRTYPVANILP